MILICLTHLINSRSLVRIVSCSIPSPTFPDATSVNHPFDRIFPDFYCGEIDSYVLVDGTVLSRPFDTVGMRAAYGKWAKRSARVSDLPERT